MTISQVSYKMKILDSFVLFVEIPNEAQRNEELFSRAERVIY
jgi:hypothetical protein